MFSVSGNLFWNIDECLKRKALVLAETRAGFHAKCPLLSFIHET